MPDLRNSFHLNGFLPCLMVATIRQGGKCGGVWHNHSDWVASSPPIKTTLIFSVDSTTTLSRICLTI